jgi:hypothetical protein
MKVERGESIREIGEEEGDRSGKRWDGRGDRGVEVTLGRFSPRQNPGFATDLSSQELIPVVTYELCVCLKQEIIK